MEDLFSTNIAVNNESVNYHVTFDKDKYIFIPDGDTKSFPSFSFRREHDQWLDEDALPGSIKEQATDALDRYLLKQH
ncbi:MAG: hypothetical protein ACXVBZ_00100 [Flavisolibacter sp.]